jgi:hypothetical protein
LSDDARRALREVQEHFRLPSIGLVEKDLYVVKAIAALAAIDAAPFTLVFGGGTALARAHKIIRRMSEDVDFKIVPLPAAPISRSGLRRALGRLSDQVTAALHAAGFAFNPKSCTRSRNENRYTVWQLPYAADSGAGEGLRPTIQIELTYAPLRQAPVTLPVSSFMAEAHSRPPEVAQIPCVSVTETAAEKLVALTRRIAMELAGLSRDPSRNFRSPAPSARSGAQSALRLFSATASKPRCPRAWLARRKNAAHPRRRGLIAALALR